MAAGSTLLTTIIADNYFASNRNSLGLHFIEPLIIADNYFASNRNKTDTSLKGLLIIADNYFASNRNALMKEQVVRWDYSR